MRVAMRLSKPLVALLAVALYICVTTTSVFAWGPWLISTDYQGATVSFYGLGNDDMFIDAVGSSEYANETTLWISENKIVLSGDDAHFVNGVVQSRSTGEFLGRGEVAVLRTNGTSSDAANAWVKSSSDATVLCHSNGDVIVSLGTP
jgi:hypothetical protein